MRWRVDADPRRAAAWAFFLSVAATLALAWLYHRRNEDQSIRAFEAQAVEAAERVVERLRLYEYGLRGARSFVLGVGDGVTRAKFQMYYESRDLGREFPGARGFGFIRRVPAGREAAFVAEVREGGIPDFSVHQLAPWSGDRYVVQYIEPLTRNRAALGFDIASEPVRREAADMAVRTGRVAITRPLTLVQARDERYSGFLVLLPIYRPDAPLGTEFERRAATIGWSYAPLVLAEVLAGLDLHAGALTIALDDADGLSGPFTRFHGARAAGEAPLVRSFVRPVFGRPGGSRSARSRRSSPACTCCRRRSCSGSAA